MKYYIFLGQILGFTGMLFGLPFFIMFFPVRIGWDMAKKFSSTLMEGDKPKKKI